MADSKDEITRRLFLTRTGQGIAVANLSGAFLTRMASAATPEEPAAPRKVGWAIVGLGRLAMNQILPAFAKCERSRVVALVSGHRDKAESLAARYGVDPKNIYDYKNYDSIRDNPDVDVIYIVLPNGMHAEYTIRGHEAGKHVLTEKPMANTPQECESMIAAAKKANRKLMVAYRCRYEPYNRAMIKLAQDRTLGAIRVIVADHGFNIGDPTQWRLKKSLAGGGSLMDIGIYSLQAARYITGEEPTEVGAMISSAPGDVRFKEVEETVNFQLRFPSGVLANCTSSYGYSGQNRYRVVTTDGWFELEPATYYTNNRMRVRHGNVTEERDLEAKDHFALEMDHMSECVQDGKDPLTPGEEGLRDLRIMMAIYESARTGKTVRM